MDRRLTRGQKKIIRGLLFRLIALFSLVIISFGRGYFSSWRERADQSLLGPITNFLYHTGGHLLSNPVLANIFGLFLSIGSVLIVFSISQYLYSKGAINSKDASRIGEISGIIWIFTAFNWISKMPVAFISVLGITAIILLNGSKNWLPCFLDESKSPNNGLVFTFVSLLILCGFFWWPGFQYICALGIAGTSVGDQAASWFGKRYGKRRLRFTKSGKTIQGVLAMFIATFIVNLLIIRIGMIQEMGMQKEIYRLLIITFAAALSTAAELFSPHGYDNLLIGPVTAFPIYLYTH